MKTKVIWNGISSNKLHKDNLRWKNLHWWNLFLNNCWRFWGFQLPHSKGFLLINGKGQKPWWFNHSMQIWLCDEGKGGMGWHKNPTKPFDLKRCKSFSIAMQQKWLRSWRLTIKHMVSMTMVFELGTSSRTIFSFFKKFGHIYMDKYIFHPIFL